MSAASESLILAHTILESLECLIIVAFKCLSMPDKHIPAVTVGGPAWQEKQVDWEFRRILGTDCW
jgi:hypothetical protein